MDHENKDSKKSLEAYLIEHARQDRVLFHMPGHKGADIYRRTGHEEFLERLVDLDVTEIPGTDDLFEPDGIILDAQERYAKLYGARQSFLLVNGASGGLIASILATAPRGGSLIVARNCHKSVFSALILGDVTPVYARPEVLRERGICGRVTPEEIGRLLDAHPEASGAVITSPNYYGIQSDIKEIADLLHERGKILIVDQAHGAHQVFFDRLAGTACSAEAAGADLSVVSIHKTLAGFGQSAVLNVGSDRVDLDRLRDALQMVQTSSPSYLLMTGLSVNAAILESEQGMELIRGWRDDVAYFYRECEGIPGLSVFTGEGYDPTKLNVGFGELGLSGDALYDVLAKDYAIDCEISGRDFVMALSGIGNVRADYDRLLAALRDISKRLSAGELEGVKAEYPLSEEIGPVSGVLHETGPLPAEKEKTPLEESAGRVLAAAIVPYPPGIPLVCPGEVMTEEDVLLIRRYREAGVTVIGVSEEGMVFTGKDRA